jgi:RND family efflux transporter MFP subunit
MSSGWVGPSPGSPPGGGADLSALTELAACEGSRQVAAFAARRAAAAAGADAALLFTPDTVQAGFVCTGAWGEGAPKALRRVAPRDRGHVRELLRERAALLVPKERLAASDDPLLQAAPAWAAACLLLPVERDRAIAAVAVLFFRRTPEPAAVSGRVLPFLEAVAPALDKARDAERKSSGMLQAIERLTSLFDLSKAFGSTIDLAELDTLIVQKAADFCACETASLWFLEGGDGEVVLAATAVNPTYDVAAPPVSVGASVVADVLADTEVLRRNSLPEDDPIRAADPAYPVNSLLAVPLVEDDAPVGVLVLANKRGRHPEFSDGDEELLVDLARQAVRALHNARQYEAEKKVEELDALLTVSREITSTLDLDKVMNAIVNSTAALIRYDRCAIGIQDRGRLRLGAVSGVLELDRSRPDLKRTAEILEWVHGGRADVSVVENEDGTLETARPETTEKFRAFFAENKLKSFYGILLKDDEGPLGVLGFESSERLVFDEETRSLLQILVNQATVAVRNAQLYRQVPLVGFLKPLLERKKRLVGVPRSRRVAWGLGALGLLVVLFLVPWRFRLAGSARVLPARRAAVTAGVDGVVARVLKLEGDSVKAGEVVAVLEDETYAAAAAAARAAYDIAEADLSRFRAAGDAAASFEAESHRKELAARIALEDERLVRTRLVAPVAGVVVTPRVQERVGQSLARGAELCVVADTRTMVAEVAIPEEEAARLQPGQPAEVKLNTYPGRTFAGAVTRVGALVREEGKDRFVVAEVALENADGLLKTGMQGRGKVRVGWSNIATLVLRRPARWLYGKLWPVLP